MRYFYRPWKPPDLPGVGSVESLREGFGHEYLR
jgi:hypothetical protein